MTPRKDKDKKKKKKSIIEAEIMAILQKSMRTALDMALDELLKDWNSEAARGSLLAVFPSPLPHTFPAPSPLT